MQAQLQQQSAAMNEMQGQFQRLLVEKQGKVIDNEYALKLKEMDIQAKLAVAEIETKAQNLSERLAFVEEFIKQQHGQAHDAGMQAQDHAHERAIADKQAANASAQSAQDPRSNRRHNKDQRQMHFDILFGMQSVLCAFSVVLCAGAAAQAQIRGRWTSR
jgi:hypothetical protein